MGAITRAAANNFTTGGVILPAGINDTSVASVSSLSNVSAGDSMVLIKKLLLVQMQIFHSYMELLE